MKRRTSPRHRPAAARVRPGERPAAGLATMIDMLLRRDWEVTFGCLRTADGSGAVRTRARAARGRDPRSARGASTRSATWTDSTSRSSPTGTSRSGFCPSCVQASPSTRVIVDSVDLHFLREMRDKLRSDAGSSPGQLETKPGRRADQGDQHLRRRRRRAHRLREGGGADQRLHRTAGPRASPSRHRGASALARAAARAARESSSSATSCTRRTATPRPISARRSSRASIRRCSPSTRSRSSARRRRSTCGDLADGLPHVKIVGWVPSVIPYLQRGPGFRGPAPLRRRHQAEDNPGADGGHADRDHHRRRRGARRARSTRGADRRRSVRVRRRRSNACCNGQLAWRRLARRGRKHVLRLHGRATVEARFDQVLETVLARRARRRR